MTGFLETFVRYVEAFDSDPVADTAARVREQGRGDRESERRARDIERISWVLKGKS